MCVLSASCVCVCVCVCLCVCFPDVICCTLWGSVRVWFACWLFFNWWGFWGIAQYFTSVWDKPVHACFDCLLPVNCLLHWEKGMLLVVFSCRQILTIPGAFAIITTHTLAGNSRAHPQHIGRSYTNEILWETYLTYCFIYLTAESPQYCVLLKTRTE